VVVPEILSGFFSGFFCTCWMTSSVSGDIGIVGWFWGILLGFFEGCCGILWFSDSFGILWWNPGFLWDFYGIFGLFYWFYGILWGFYGSVEDLSGFFDLFKDFLDDLWRILKFSCSFFGILWDSLYFLPISKGFDWNYLGFFFSRNSSALTSINPKSNRNLNRKTKEIKELQPSGTGCVANFHKKWRLQLLQGHVLITFHLDLINSSSYLFCI